MYFICFLRHIVSLIHLLRYLHDKLSSSRVDELLHFVIALVNSSSKKEFYFIVGLLIISSSKSKLISWLWAKLKEKWSAYQRSLSLIYRWLLYWIALMARSFHFLTQFISFQGLYFLLAISWIFELKKLCFIFLTILLNCF